MGKALQAIQRRQLSSYGSNLQYFEEILEGFDEFVVLIK